MHSKHLFHITLLTLISAGIWGLSRTDIMIFEPLKKSQTPPSNSSIINRTNQSTINIKQADNSGTLVPVSEKNDVVNAIEQLIVSGDVRQAAHKINQHYSDISSEQLQQLKNSFLNSALQAHNNEKKDILIAASQAFDDLDVWKTLADVAIRSNDWQMAFDAQFRASELESDPIELENLVQDMIKSSAYLQALFEKNNDLLSIRALYQGLINLHTNVPLFQFKLANIHARLSDYDAAENMFIALSYEPEFSDIAKQALLKIKNSKPMHNPTSSLQQPDETHDSNDIVVPLIAIGSSYLVDASVNKHTSRLLLDTGASITALSSELIQRLNLSPTGQSIQLSTANGLTRAQLYQVDSLSLGRLTLSNMTIAEIDLGQQRPFDGLLGTDALNQFKSRYSYIIDNDKNALIFRVR